MPKSREVKYTQISFKGSTELNDLLDVYRKDKLNAGVIFRFKKVRLVTSRVCFFEEGRNHWEICKFNKVWGISKNNKLYSKETKEWSIKSINGGVWYRSKFGKDDKYNIRYFKPLHLHCLTDISNGDLAIVKAKLLEKLPYLSYIYEFNILNNCTIHTIRKNKLYSLKKAIQFEYGINKDTYYRIKNFLEIKQETAREHKTLTRFNAYKDVLLNVDKFNTSWLEGNMFSLFMDTLGCARALGKTINCAWSDRRLNDEHTAYTQEIIKVLYKDDSSPLTLDGVFIKFSEFSGFTLFRNVNEVYAEGLMRSHCVATHIPNINNGSIGVYNIYNLYTLELAKKTFWVKSKVDSNGKAGLSTAITGVCINEFKGKGNTSVPSDILFMVEEKINEFNLSLGVPKSEIETIYNKKSEARGFLMDNDDGDRFLAPARVANQDAKEVSIIDIF